MKHVNRRLRLAFVLLFITLAALTSAFAQITPSQDSYTDSSRPTTNFGSATTLGVASSAASIQNTYIQFDLSSVPFGYTGANVVKATLKVYVNSVTKPGSFNVDLVNGGWSEKTISSSLSPALGTTIASSVPLTSAKVNDYVLIDVTPAVQEWLNGSQANDGLALVANSGLVATFDSKENAAQSHPAELDVVFGSGSSIAAVNTPSGGGLTGGGDSGTLNLSLQPCSTGQVLQWNGSAWACASAATGTITGVTAGAELTGGGTSGNVTVNLDTTQVPLLNAANTFTAVQTINNQVLISATTGGYSLSVGGNASGIIGSTYTTAGYGVTGSHDATTGNGAGLYGLTFSPSGSGVLGIGGTGIEGRATICCGSGGIFTGYSVPANSGQVATYGIKATGGNGDVNDPNNQTGDGVFAQGGSGAFGGFGIRAYAGTGPIGDGIGGLFLGGNSSIHGDGILAESGSGFAGSFVGNVQVLGTLSATVKNFKIDHPLDPGNKYLVHASVESSELMNIYTGNIITDAQGEATVSMPEWFEALNTDFRYQLTVVGQFAQAIVGHKIENHQFQIKTNAPSVEVSWQVTAVRQDAYAKAHPLLVEEEKETPLKGFYIHPELYGAADEKQIEWARHPGIMQHMKDHRSKEVATAKP